VVVGSLSALTALVLLIPYISRLVYVTVWSFVIFVLWVAVFGLFGRIYFNAKPDSDLDIKHIRAVVWIDLTNTIVWLLGTVFSGVEYWLVHTRRSRFTGRAKV
jgi:hypothetical protein